MLFLLLLCSLLCPIVGTKLNLYNTEATLDLDNVQVNCLHSYNSFGENGFEKTEYCLGPIQKNSFDDVDLIHIKRKLTFDQMRQLDIDINELLSWSATIDLAEKYQDYLHHHNESLLSNEVFFECTKPWFGPQCQFSFDMDQLESFQQIIRQTFYKRIFSKSLYGTDSLTCYTHIKCDRGGANLCLDWREVCNRRIDCIGGEDEVQCFPLEVNQYSEDEYRCHNGLCISKVFLDDNVAHCLDQSDLLDRHLNRYNGNPYLMNDEDVGCRSSSEQFTCGDGQCVADYDQCDNERHLLLINSISGQGDLSYSCWMMIICLTLIPHSNNRTFCEQLLTWSNVTDIFQSCDEVIEFPTVPVLFGHIRFPYSRKTDIDLKANLPLLPDYICYDQQLCDFLPATFFFEGYSCRKTDQLDINWSRKVDTWVSIISLVDGYFRKCSIRFNISKDQSHSSSLYCCQNSSKCISKDRILDNIFDCYLNDDEEQTSLSCSMTDSFRFKCLGQSKCYSSVVPKTICPLLLLRNFDQIQFREICDRSVDMFSLTIDGRNHTDEIDCDHWPCSSFYARCDGFWSCLDGSDEENCTEEICPSHTLPCVSPWNFTVSCLPASEVNNGHIDCLGSIDELEHCRTVSKLSPVYEGFRCLNSEKCIFGQFLCDKRKDCPFDDDEAFCQGYENICDQPTNVDQITLHKAICLLSTVKKIPFSLGTSPIYPPVEIQTTVHTSKQRIERHEIENFVNSKAFDSRWLWRCNHGLSVNHWLGGENITSKCLCPPTHYGDRCEYQNQRISFTARLEGVSGGTVYAVMVSLIDQSKDSHQINSFFQLTYYQYPLLFSASEICHEDINGYLTYRRRVNDGSTNFSVRVDLYNTTNLTYLAAWDFPVPFPFLPINRMSVTLYLLFEASPIVSKCPIRCENGQCRKYLNEEKYYCRCHSRWSGVRCDMPIRCNDCSNDSLCVGMISNRSICLCPLHKGGLHCLLTYPADEDFCYGNSEYITVDDGMNDFAFLCICPDEFFGATCEFQYNKLSISMENIKFSSILLIYIIHSKFLANNVEEVQVIDVKEVSSRFDNSCRDSPNHLCYYSSLLCWVQIFILHLMVSISAS